MIVETFARLFFGFLFQVVPFGVLAIYPFWNSLRLSKRRAIALIACLVPCIAVLFAGAGCYLQSQLPHDDILFATINIVFGLCLFPCFIVYIVLVRATWQERLFVFSFALTCAWGITAITSITSVLYGIGVPGDGLPYKGWLLPLFFVLGIICTPPLVLLLKRKYVPVRNSISWRESTILALLSLAMFLVLAYIYIYAIVAGFTESINPLTLVLFVVAATMIYAVYGAALTLLQFSSERLATERETSRMEHALQLQSQQIESLDNAQRHDRRIRHDMRHALATIQGLVMQGHYDTSLELIDEYAEMFRHNNFTRYCENEAINSIVNHYAETAKERAVQFHAQINLSDNMTITIGEFCVALGNLLDNATTAASQAAKKDRWVQLGIVVSGDAVAITVDNGFAGNVKTDGSRYLSTKPAHSGLGLESVAFIAKKYNGVAEFTHESNAFHASVMLINCHET